MSHKLVISALLFALAAVGILGFVKYYETMPKYKLIKINGATIRAELADNPTKKVKGLSGRDKLDPQEGMLFVFSYSIKPAMWMKDTHFPLDLIFIDAENSINHVVPNVQPCNDMDCPTYSSEKPTKYVLEVAGGFSQSHNIKEGDKITILK